MKMFGAIIGLLVLLLGGIFLFYRLAYDPQNDTFEPERTTLSGIYGCLPLRDTSASQQDCAAGLYADTGEYYAIDFGLYAEGMPQLIEGDLLKAQGVVTPIERLSTDYWQKYPVMGIFSVTDSLEILDAPEAPVATSTASTTLTNIRWVWKYTDHSDGTRRLSENDDYVLTFNEDLTYESSTDCNGLSGTYVVDHEVLSIAQPAMTKMFCEGSDEMTYVSELELTNSYVVEGDTLRLNLNLDGGTMIFNREE
jgi:heat shock protein HslJ